MDKKDQQKKEEKDRIEADAAPEKGTMEADASAADEASADETASEGANPEAVKPENENPEEAKAEASAEEGAAEEPEKPQAPDWKEMYARTMADFDNYRKRMARDREELFKSAAVDVLKDVLPTVDNLARALGEAVDKDDPFVKGVQLVYDGLVKMLADHGATPIDSVGEPLDTNFHEAIATLPSPEVPEGHVMTEVKRGWLLNGKVLRAAQVVVSAGKGE